jgi:hypothetical protein
MPGFIDEADPQLQARCQEDVARVLPEFNEYIDHKERAYEVRAECRRQYGIPAVILGGWGRAGKDEAAKALHEMSSLVYYFSASQVVLPLIARAQDLPLSEAWEQRHEHRRYWYECCNVLRAKDPTILPRWVLGAADLVPGVRGKVELLASLQLGVADTAIWISRPGIPPDPTTEYVREDCPHEIVNDGTLDDLRERLCWWLKCNYRQLLLPPKQQPKQQPLPRAGVTPKRLQYLLGATEQTLAHARPGEAPTYPVNAAFLREMVLQLEKMQHALSRVTLDPLLSVLVQRVDPKAMFQIGQALIED